MDDAQFWTLVDQSRGIGAAAKPPGLLRRLTGGGTAASNTAFLASLHKSLLGLDPKEIIAFKVCYERQSDRAYTWDLWAAAYLLMGGCSDDGFDYWRAWLISQGRETFERALQDPDSLAELPKNVCEEDMCFEDFVYSACKAYEERTGEEIWDHLPEKPSQGDGPPEPAGEPWEESDEALRERLPALFARCNG